MIDRYESYIDKIHWDEYIWVQSPCLEYLTFILPNYFTYMHYQTGCARTPSAKNGVKFLIFILEARFFFNFFVRMSTIHFCNKKLLWYVLRYPERPIFEERWEWKNKNLWITKKIFIATKNKCHIWILHIEKNINIITFHQHLSMQWYGCNV